MVETYRGLITGNGGKLAEDQMLGFIHTGGSRTWTQPAKITAASPHASGDVCQRSRKLHHHHQNSIRQTDSHRLSTHDKQVKEDKEFKDGVGRNDHRTDDVLEIRGS